MNANLGSLKNMCVYGLYFLFIVSLGAVMYIGGDSIAPQTRLPTHYTRSNRIKLWDLQMHQKKTEEKSGNINNHHYK